jgi:hypothetical protein
MCYCILNRQYTYIVRKYIIYLTSSREKTISENSIKTTASESPPEQALYFEAKANAHRTYSDPNAPRNMSHMTTEL